MSQDDRKARVDSPEEAVKTMLAATQVIEPPPSLDLDSDEHEVFDNVIAEFAKVAWTAHTIYLAASLARTMVQMTSDQKLIKGEGTVIENARGNPCLNPRVTAVNTANGSILSMRRSLALHAMAGGDKRDAATRGQHQRDQQNGSPLNDDDEDLLARPPSHAMN